MSNVYNNHQYDEQLKRNEVKEYYHITLDQDQAEAMFTLVGILDADSPLSFVYDMLHREGVEQTYQINEPDDTLRLWK